MSEAGVDESLADPIQRCQMRRLTRPAIPYVQPMWFLLDGDWIFTTAREQSKWHAHIRHDPRRPLVHR